MRVIVADPSAFTPPYDHALCSALARAGAQVELATSRFVYGPVPPVDGFARVERFYRVSSRWLADRPGSPVRLVAKLAEHPLDMGRFVRDVRRAAPDVVHFQWLTVQPLDIAFLRRIDRPVVLTAHDVVPREPRPGQLGAMRRLYRSVEAIVVHSDHGRDRLVDELGTEPAKVHVIPHGAFDYLTRLPRGRVDPSLGELGDRPVVLFFGLVRPYKGIEVLIDAFARVPEDALLLVVGMPRMPLAPLVERAGRLGLGGRVRFLPRFVPDTELPAYFDRADLVVLPYREIDQSGVLCTALAFARPVIASAVGGFAEVADRHGALCAVAPGDTGALAEAITRLLGDRAERRRLAEAAARAARGPFSWDAVAARTLDLYRTLTAGSGSGGGGR